MTGVANIAWEGDHDLKENVGAIVVYVYIHFAVQARALDKHQSVCKVHTKPDCWSSQSECFMILCTNPYNHPTITVGCQMSNESSALVTEFLGN